MHKVAWLKEYIYEDLYIYIYIYLSTKSNNFN